MSHATAPAETRLCRCSAPQADHSGPGNRGGCEATGCAKFERDRRRERAIALADEHPSVAVIAWDAARPRSKKTERARSRGEFGVGPSDLNECRKRIEYREAPPDDYEPLEVDRMPAHIGTALHDMLTAARRRRYRYRRFRVPVHIVGVPEPGEADEYDPYIGRVTDYKTAGEYAWELVGKYGPQDGQWAQVLVYGLGLEDAGERVAEVELLFVRRSNGQTESFRRAYSRDAAMAALARLHGILDALEAGVPLPRDRTGPSTDTVCARYCPAAAHCWNIPAAELAGRSPESWTLVHDDADVERVLVMYDEAREEESGAKKRKAQMKVLLEGVEESRYGVMTYGHTRSSTKQEPDVDARVKQLEARLDELAPGEVLLLPYPTKTVVTGGAVQVKRVRAAVLEAEAAQQDAAAEEEPA